MPVFIKIGFLLCVPHQKQHDEIRQEFPQLCHGFPRKPSGRPIFSTLPFPDKLVFHIKTDFCTENREKRDKYFIFAVQSAVQQVAKDGNTEKAKQKQRQLFFPEPAFSKYPSKESYCCKGRKTDAVRRIAETQDQKLRFPHRRVGKESCDPALCAAASAATAAEQCSSRWNQ